MLLGSRTKHFKSGLGTSIVLILNGEYQGSKLIRHYGNRTKYFKSVRIIRVELSP